jgi:DNA-binding LacI/PurR family transcriptional regulator
MDELLAHPGERPTAVVAGIDLVALRVIRRLRVQGLLVRRTCRSPDSTT